ncbi:AAA and adenylate/guanylate cyclase domain-containing protein [uncultured Sulfitobacter sp.]|uniref:AAA and adenylate/guanylate cyclase domain-containing protein n=1 Tax=uncultured Sulfitobacter sp. TaxID=191468 RepID=UPI0026335610|nr:AAA and adenylate/guanylate cyclase domain-containing protein [uncultured Sulfitobacter sp.]
MLTGSRCVEVKDKRDLSYNPAEIHAKVECTTAVLLFIDIAGFSKMSADLVAHDTRGAEEIMRVLNTAFGLFINTIAENGGTVATTAGDALLAFWQVGDDLGRTAQAAQKAAQDIRALPQTHGASHASVTVKMLLDYGPLDLMTVGGHAGKWAKLFAGDLLAELNAHAAQLSPKAITLTPAFEAVLDQAQVNDLAPSPAVHLHDSLGYIQPAQSESITLRRPAEFRQVAVMFVKLPPAHRGDLAQTQTVAETVQNAIATQGGALLHFQSDDKGVVGIGVWGIPDTAHESQSARAVFAANQIASRLTERAIPVQIGVTTGNVLAGEIGNDHFRQYTVLSEVVNLASVLAVHAKNGEVLCDAHVVQHAGSRFTFEQANAVRLKGETHTVAAFTPLSEHRTDTVFDHDLIGRTAEFETFRSLFEGAAKNAQPLLRVLAPAGLGKSHLGAAFGHWMAQQGIRCLNGASDALRQADAYCAWRPVFAHLTEDHPRDSIQQLLGENIQYAALLNPVLGRAQAETAASETLSPAARAQLAGDLTIDLLRKLIGDQPTAIIFEDTHWLDSASWGLIAQCRRQIPEVAMLLLTRPVPDDAMSITALTLLQGDDVTTIELKPFDRAGSDALIGAQLGAQDIPPALGARVFELAGGNPLFTKELTKLILEQGIVRVANGHCHISTGQITLEHSGFPKNLGATLAERIDTLPLGAQRLIKEAAIQGRNVDKTVLAKMYGTEDTTFIQLLDDIIASGLMEYTDGDTCRFHHALIAETAYDLLLRETRQALHLKVAATMESCGFADSPNSAGLLAYHWEAGGETARALPYFDRALIRASGQHANEEVLRYGKKALELGKLHPEFVTDERAMRWHNALQTAYRSQGHLTGTDEHLRSIMAIADKPPPQTSASYIGGTLREFIRLKTGGKIKGLSQEAKLISATAHLTSAEVAYDRQDTLRVLHGSLRGANLAFSAEGDAVEIATANAQMAMTAVFIRFALNGDAFAARCERMLPNLDDDRAKSWILVVLSSYEFCSGRFDKSNIHADAAMAAATRSREAKNWEYAASGKANVLRLQAQFAETDALDKKVYDSGHDRAVPQVKLWGTVGRLKNMWITNQFDLFEQWIDRSASLLSDDLNKLNSAASNTIGHHIFSALNDIRLGNSERAFGDLMITKRLFEGLRDPQVYMVDPLSYIMDAVRGLRHAGRDTADILPLTDFVLKSAKKVHHLYPMCWARRHLAQGDWHEARGQLAKAIKHWQLATATDGPVDLPFDNAMAHYRLAQFGKLGSAQSADHERAVTDILDRLNVELPVSWSL